MEIIISNNANKPIYEQITSQIKAMIMSGELQAGDAIPSMRSLAKSIHVSVITVQKAYEDLVLLKQLLAGGVLYRHKTKNFIKKNNNVLQRNIYKPPQRLDGQVIFPLKN